MIRQEPGIRLLATDLDGTLLDSGGRLAEANRQALVALGEAGVVRVIATGRSWYSFRRALPGPDLPVDYLICSTGAGIIDMSSGELIRSLRLGSALVEKTEAALHEAGVSFILQEVLPDNHRFHYLARERVPDDFHRRLAAYQGFGTPLIRPGGPREASQFLVILEGGPEAFEGLAQSLEGVKVIRTTSPIDHKTCWMEIFPPEVSKGHALEWLAWSLGYPRQAVAAVGNDFNDLDMLDFAARAFVAGNAPLELKFQYNALPHHDQPILPELMERLGISM